MQVEDCKEINDCYKWLLEQKSKGIFQICHYEDKSQQELERWHCQIYNYMKEKEMQNTPECSYAKFVQKKFPKIWEKLEKRGD